MTIPQPPIQPDDTQPNPTLSTRDAATKPMLPLWLWLLVIVISAVSLIATLRLVWTPDSDTVIMGDTRTVTLRVDGLQRDVTTSANTVGDVLAQEQIEMGSNDAVYPDRGTRLSDQMVITVARARLVSLTVGDQTQSLETPFENPTDILAQANVTLTDNDRIYIDGTLATRADLAQWTVPVTELIIQPTATITVQDGESTQQFVTTAMTVADALFEADIDIFLTDTVMPDLSTAITGNMTITIDRAQPATIFVDGVTVETRVQGATVADALAESGIALAGLDYTIPELDAEITPETMITVLRVSETIETTETAIPFETVYQADSNLNLDTQQVIQAGQAGVERFSERVRFENGVEVAREPLGTEVITASQNRIIGYGTNIVLRTINTPEGSREYWRVIRAYATSYHPAALGGDNITAIGMELRKGIIAADPDIIPYRTNLYVPNYGIGIMADTGGPRSSPYWVDLGYSDADWVGWSQYVDVYLLTPVPAEIDYLLPNFTTMRGLPDN